MSWRNVQGDESDFPESAQPCPQGCTDYEACFAPFRYCPVKGCGRGLSNEPRWCSHCSQNYAATTDTYRRVVRAVSAAVDEREAAHWWRRARLWRRFLSDNWAVDAAVYAIPADELERLS